MAYTAPGGKKRVCYYYDGESCLVAACSVDPFECLESISEVSAAIMHYNFDNLLAPHAGCFASNKRRHRELLLWPRTPYETASDTYDTQPAAQLWPVQKNGDLCEYLGPPGLPLRELPTLPRPRSASERKFHSVIPISATAQSYTGRDDKISL